MYGSAAIFAVAGSTSYEKFCCIGKTLQWLLLVFCANYYQRSCHRFLHCPSFYLAGTAVERQFSMKIEIASISILKHKNTKV